MIGVQRVKWRWIRNLFGLRSLGGTHASSQPKFALELEARLALVLRLLGRRQLASRGVRVEVDGRREGVGAVGVVVVVGVLGADGELALEDVANGVFVLVRVGDFNRGP